MRAGAERGSFGMQAQDRPIAFFDSGLGGISVLRETVRLMPQENYL